MGPLGAMAAALVARSLIAVPCGISRPQRLGGKPRQHMAADLGLPACLSVLPYPVLYCMAARPGQGKEPTMQYWLWAAEQL